MAGFLWFNGMLVILVEVRNVGLGVFGSWKPKTDSWSKCHEADVASLMTFA